jgi:hypothetical protein
MAKLVVKGVEVEHSGNLLDALQDHPNTVPLSSEDIEYRNRVWEGIVAARAARAANAAAEEEEESVPGVTLTNSDEAQYNNLKYTYAGVTGSVLNAGTVFHTVMETGGVQALLVLILAHGKRTQIQNLLTETCYTGGAMMLT